MYIYTQIYICIYTIWYLASLSSYSTHMSQIFWSEFPAQLRKSNLDVKKSSKSHACCKMMACSVFPNPLLKKCVIMRVCRYIVNQYKQKRIKNGICDHIQQEIHQNMRQNYLVDWVTTSWLIQKAPEHQKNHEESGSPTRLHNSAGYIRIWHCWCTHQIQLFLLYSLQLHVGVGVALEKNIHQNMPPVTRASGKNDKIVQLPSQLFSQNSAKRLPVQNNHNKHHEHQGTPRFTRMCPLKLGKERTELLMERIHYIRTRPSNPK